MPRLSELPTRNGMRRGVQIRYSTRVGKEGPSYLEGMGTALLAALDAEVHLGRRPSGGSSPLPFKSATGCHINEMRCDANFMPNFSELCTRSLV